MCSGCGRGLLHRLTSLKVGCATPRHLWWLPFFGSVQSCESWGVLSTHGLTVRVFAALLFSLIALRSASVLLRPRGFAMTPSNGSGAPPGAETLYTTPRFIRNNTLESAEPRGTGACCAVRTFWTLGWRWSDQTIAAVSTGLGFVARAPVLGAHFAPSPALDPRVRVTPVRGRERALLFGQLLGLGLGAGRRRAGAHQARALLARILRLGTPVRFRHDASFRSAAAAATCTKTTCRSAGPFCPHSGT